MRNETMKAIREAIREPYVFPGGYQKTVVMSDGETLCIACTKSEYRLISDSTRHNSRDGWQAEGVQVNWEGPDYHCAHCDNLMQTEYGNPESEETSS